jgi:hypothetical protein
MLRPVFGTAQRLRPVHRNALLSASGLAESPPPELDISSRTELASLLDGPQ